MDMRQNRGGAYPFCERCTNMTLDVRAPGTYTLNGIGTRFYGWRDPCPHCGSVLRTLFFCMLWVPLVPLDRYRIIEVPSSWWQGPRYVGRKIRPGADRT